MRRPQPPIFVLLVLLLAIAPGAACAEGDGEAAAGAESSPPVSLDRLLKLPGGLRYEVENRGGATRSEWRRRFLEAHHERDEAAENLEGSRTELEEMAAKSGAWGLGTPGTQANSDPDTPLSFELYRRIDREERELKEADEKLRSLEVEANLAKVPKAWRAKPPAPQKAAESDSDPRTENW